MSRRPTRFWLISISIAAHFAVGLGLFAAGVWRLEKLESDYRMAGIGLMVPSIEGGGSPAALPAHKFQKKPTRTAAKDPHQPVKREDKLDSNEQKTREPGDEDGEGTGDGKGKGDAKGTGEGTPGFCAVPPCTGAIEIPAEQIRKPAPQVRMVAPTLMSALRTSGETQIHPAPMVKREILNDGRGRLVGVVKVCLEASGAIASATLLSSTKYPAYDAQLLAGVRSWRYRPYTVDGVAVPACSAVSFVYTIQ
jgi:TonB family protein